MRILVLSVLLSLVASPALAETKFYADAITGRYIGGFDGSVPTNGVEVATPPQHASFYIWNGSAWIEDADRADREADAGIMGAFELSKRERLMFEIMFELVNDIRVLKGQGAITKAQYHDALVTRWKAL